MSDDWVPVDSAAALRRDGEQVTARDRYGNEVAGRLDVVRGVVHLGGGRLVAARLVHLTLNPGPPPPD